MAHIKNGSGKFGVYIKHADGDTEEAWYPNKDDREKVFHNMNRAPDVKKVKRIERK